MTGVSDPRASEDCGWVDEGSSGVCWSLDRLWYCSGSVGCSSSGASGPYRSLYAMSSVAICELLAHFCHLTSELDILLHCPLSLHSVSNRQHSMIPVPPCLEVLVSVVLLVGMIDLFWLAS